MFPEGAGAFRPLNVNCNRCGFSHGPFVHPLQTRPAPQEARTNLVTAPTAERRS
jgi:hypothetical protein